MSDSGSPIEASATGPRLVDPRATHRIQLTPAFTFDDAAGIAPYLQALAISHVYASPYLRAMPGSLHGYDVVDLRRVNPALGGEEGHARDDGIALAGAAVALPGWSMAVVEPAG